MLVVRDMPTLGLNSLYVGDTKPWTQGLVGQAQEAELTLTMAPPSPLWYHFLSSQDPGTPPYLGGCLHQTFEGRRAVLASLWPHFPFHLERAGLGAALGEDVGGPGEKDVFLSGLNSLEAIALPSNPASGTTRRTLTGAEARGSATSCLM